MELAADVNTNGTKYAGVYFKQTCLIDLDSVPFIGIGCISQQASGKSFQGYYDGNGQTIDNIVFANKDSLVTDIRYRGVFNSTSGGAVISNLTVNLVGMFEGVTGEYGGGLIGFSGTSSSLIFDTTVVGCKVHGTMTTTANCGGIVGRAYGGILVKDCDVDLAITVAGNSNRAAGLIAHTQNQGEGPGAVVENCTFTGSITALEGATGGTFAGIVGGDSKTTVKDCTVNATFSFYGDVIPAKFGQIAGNGTMTSLGTNICKSDVIALGSSKTADGLNFATVDAGVATLISNDQVVVAAAAPAPTYLVMSKIATLPVAFDTVGQTIAFDVALNTAFVADITATGVGVETNLAENVLTYTAIELPPFIGSGTEDDPFQIKTVADLQKLDELVDGGETFAGKYFEQKANIDMTGVTWGGIGTVGGTGKAFSGVYDGAGFAITGLTTTNTGNYCGILFNNVDNGVIKNLIAAATVDASGGFSMFGGANASVFSNVTVRGSIVGTHHCGGFTSFGQWSDGASTYIDCVNEAAVASSKSAGGFCGKPQTDAIFIRCVNKGTIGADGKMGGDGGLAGFCSGGAYGQFTDCVNEGVVLGTFGQFGSSAPTAVAGTLVARTDQLAATVAFDGVNFGTVAGDVATLISNDQVVVGGEYKVMSKIATLPVAFDTVGQTIAFDVALNTAFVADITATGVGVTTNLAENLLTYTAIELPTPQEDWPTDPTVEQGKDAKTVFPNLPATFEGADAGLVAAWAKNPAKGNLAYADMATANIDAFLLDCAAADVETEAAKFKIISIENVNGEWVVKVTGEKAAGDNYTVNAKVDIVDITDEFDEVANGATEAKGFFKAELVPFVITK